MQIPPPRRLGYSLSSKGEFFGLFSSLEKGGGRGGFSSFLQNANPSPRYERGTPFFERESSDSENPSVPLWRDVSLGSMGEGGTLYTTKIEKEL